MLTHRCTQADDGRTLHLRQGERLRIELPEHTTGHRWQWVASGALTVKPADVGAAVAQPGAAVLRGFEAEALVVGTHRMVIELRRPWEPLALKAAAVFTLVVEVSP